MVLQYLAGRGGFGKSEMQTELHPQRMYIFRQCTQTIRKFRRVGMPIPDSACPPQVYDEHLHTQAGGDVRIAAQEWLIDLLLVSPGVPRHVGKSFAVRRRSGEDMLHKTLRAVACFVPIAMKQANESIRYLKFAV